MLLLGFLGMQHHVSQTDSKRDQNENTQLVCLCPPLGTSFITVEELTNDEANACMYSVLVRKIIHRYQQGVVGLLLRLPARNCRSLTRRRHFAKLHKVVWCFRYTCSTDAAQKLVKLHFLSRRAFCVYLQSTLYHSFVS